MMNASCVYWKKKRATVLYTVVKFQNPEQFLAIEQKNNRVI